MGASFSIFACFVSSFGCFVFEFWVLRFRNLDAWCFGLRFRVLRFRNYCVELPRLQYIDLSEIADVVKAVVIVTDALLNLSMLFVVSHFFKC